MKVYLKFSLVVGLSFILAGCQPNKQKTEAFPADKNQVVKLKKVPTDLLEKSESVQHEDVGVAYQLADDNQVLNLTEERYENGEKLSRELVMDLSQVNPKGYLTLRVEELKGDEALATKEYQLILKLIGTEQRHGEARWQVNANEQATPLVDYVISVPSEHLDATVEQAIFGIKFSSVEKPTALSVNFLKEPEKHLAEVGETEVAYLFRSHFIKK